MDSFSSKSFNASYDQAINFCNVDTELLLAIAECDSNLSSSSLLVEPGKAKYHGLV